ncbi:hypothetical protein SAMN05216235_2424 [Salinicoccus halodurans]|uniref:Uncharacterized protein n=1 Tax=Salinicoccus halodurans TaxID=407035 RepID=A0AA94HHU4_9STAP|nr:hypothetical protein SAMN05216235_2424 [Salinicoccus halodurans]
MDIPFIDFIKNLPKLKQIEVLEQYEKDKKNIIIH